LAIHVANQGWGILNLIYLPIWLKVFLSLLALDATAYILHVALHRIPPLWRIHAVHHCDKDFDCTTGLRFHPIEALIALTLRLTAIAALGIPVIAVVIFELWVIMAAFYTHANTKIPFWFDDSVRKFFVTPNMHRIHHSALQQDSMRNFGVIFSVWDRLFRTYQDRSAASGEGFPIGLPWFNKRPSLGIARLIALPLISTPFKAQAVEQDRPTK
jgi:sterol desaturase/sphingolipid hydroxylase (fatty acid hydroxylase superfamily)